MKIQTIALIVLAISILGRGTTNNNWVVEKHMGYNIYYTSIEKENINEYSKFVNNGVKSVLNFFPNSRIKEFDVYVHPNRQSLDSAWQKDWNMPDFKSECWMVASGIANKLDVISPKQWSIESCEHNYSDTVGTQRLITHELVHVFHGQHNLSPDFNDIDGIDWFVEGLATYVSGQMDAKRIAQVKELINSKGAPQSLNKFWTGNYKYALAGSMVMSIDKKYGRSKLFELLKFNKLDGILSSLNTTEEGLVSNWREFMQHE